MTARQASAVVAEMDPALAKAYERHGPVSYGPKIRATDRFGRLARSIVGQQVSTKAARSIWSRVENSLTSVTPETILATGPKKLRSLGISNAKCASLLDLGDAVASGELRLDTLGHYSDHRVTEELTKIRGIGPWTADMFLIFVLQRLDIWPVGDLGVRKGYAAVFDLGEVPGPDVLQPLGDRFRPYRSIVASYCWRALDSD